MKYCNLVNLNRNQSNIIGNQVKIALTLAAFFFLLSAVLLAKDGSNSSSSDKSACQDLGDAFEGFGQDFVRNSANNLTALRTQLNQLNQQRDQLNQKLFDLNCQIASTLFDLNQKSMRLLQASPESASQQTSGGQAKDAKASIDINKPQVASYIYGYISGKTDKKNGEASMYQKRYNESEFDKSYEPQLKSGYEDGYNGRQANPPEA